MFALRKSSITFAAGLLAVGVLAGCGGKNSKAARNAGTSAEPDKILYERGLDDMKHGREEVARLTLQTLLNTYPDSEYLAKAKLAIADSYFKDGGTAGLKQSISEYKDFRTFFPYLDEAAYAQLQVGMAHYRMMEKPDRDRTEAQFAEQEFQAFLLTYPKDKLADQATQRLREIQEVLAEGDFRVARFYYLRGSYRASSARLNEIVDRYPLYSRADEALWMLAKSYDKFEKNDYAARYYSRIVRDYPLSAHVDDAKKNLAKLGYPVPQPDAAALARMQHERELDRERPGIMRRSLGILKTGPDVTNAARAGDPALMPAGEPSGTETLRAGGQAQIVASGAGASASSSGTTADGSSGAGSSAPVQTVAAGPPGPEGVPVAPVGTSATSDPSAPDGASTEQPAPADDPNALLPNHTDPNAKKKPTDKSKESTSKKKKGLRKLIPF
jgi:outer membrane protein assembly factor BamD